MDNSKAKTKSNKVKTKKKFKFKPIYIIPIVFVICCLLFAFYIYSETRTDGPVYGSRCENVLTIDETKLNEAQATIASNEKITSLSIQKNCLTVKMVFNFAEGVSVEEAKTIATEATKILDTTLGYEKNNPDDQYSKIFGTDGDRRQYDIQLSLLGSGDGFPIFGNKQYQSDEINYTDANVKDQSLVDSLTEDNKTE